MKARAAWRQKQADPKGALWSLRSKKNLAAEKPRETHFLSNEEIEK
jgi:hypothetical protein